MLPGELPPRVSFFVTSRPGEIADRLARKCPEPLYKLEPTSETDLEDAAEFCRRRRFAGAGLSGFVS